MSSDQQWRHSHPNPCTPGPGQALNAKTGYLTSHDSALSPSCKSSALTNSKLKGALQKRNLEASELTVLSIHPESYTNLSSLTHVFHMNLSRNLLVGVVPFESSFLRRLGKKLDLSGKNRGSKRMGLVSLRSELMSAERMLLVEPR
ncbi:hypothetical protein Bca101_080444 [Brassica carinata]